MIVGKGDFITYIKKELVKLEFCNIAEEEIAEIINGQNTGILIEYNGEGLFQARDINSIPVIYPFDFVDGAGAIVVSTALAVSRMMSPPRPDITRPWSCTWAKP